MIDVENQIYTKIKNALDSSYPGINVTGTVTYSPSVFPTVCIEEADNASYLPTRDTESNENHVEVMYEVNVFTNDFSNAKSKCKKIFSTVDEVMDNLGFTRSAMAHVSTENQSVYRLVGRYTAVIGKNQTIYRR